MRSTELFFEIIDGYNAPYAVTQGEKVRTKQRIYMHNGGAFPTECVLDIPAPPNALAVGKYKLLPTAFKVSKFGGPEINNWEILKNLVSYVEPKPQQLHSAAQQAK